MHDGSASVFRVRRCDFQGFLVVYMWRVVCVVSVRAVPLGKVWVNVQKPLNRARIVQTPPPPGCIPVYPAPPVFRLKPPYPAEVEPSTQFHVTPSQQKVPMGVLPDPCAHGASFTVLFVPQIHNA